MCSCNIYKSIDVDNSQTYMRNTATSDSINLKDVKLYWTLFRKRLRYYIPVFQWAPDYSASLFSHDIFSGLSIASLLIPQALSYATTLCRVPAVNGLYTASVSGLIYGCLGMSPHLSVGPEATVSLMIGASIAQQSSRYDGEVNPETAAAVASLTALFVGIFTLGLGLLRFGFLDSLISRALLRGFITAVAVVVIVQQTILMLGLEEMARLSGIKSDSTTIERCIFIFLNIRHAHPLTTIVSTSTLIVLFGSAFAKRQCCFIKRVPEVLLVVVTSIIVCRWNRLDLAGLSILGSVGSSGINSPLPVPSIPYLPAWGNLRTVLMDSAMISIIGFIESIAASKLFGRRYNYFVSANRELVALGVNNVIGGFFGAFPAFGSFPRSKVHETVYPKTQMSGIIAGVTTLAATAFLLPVFFYLPKATLCCIIFVAVTSLLQELPSDLRFMWKLKAWKDAALLGTIFFTTMIFSLEVGTCVAIIISLVATVRNNSCPRINALGRVKGTSEFLPINSNQYSVEHIKDTLIVRIEEPLHFGNAGKLKERLRRIELFGNLDIHPSEDPSKKDVNSIIIDLAGMVSIDPSGVHVLYEAIESYTQQNIEVYLVSIQSNTSALLHRADIFCLVPSNYIFSRLSEAVEAVEIKSRPLVSIE
ncbi:sulfate transporter family-domain-containing protein [Phycomyces blakesleeanus]|uniref:Sulfate transporter family-domain-containing protein n=2 Tax=Phycomyces blakesleeanus TaxID=4837 RepID=A0ABR3B3J3_PHYBL